MNNNGPKHFPEEHLKVQQLETRDFLLLWQFETCSKGKIPLV